MLLSSAIAATGEAAEPPADSILRTGPACTRRLSHRSMSKAQRRNVPQGPTTAKAIDCSENHWPALTRYPRDRKLPADANWIENRIPELLPRHSRPANAQ
jgi:hypothetical protein